MSEQVKSALLWLQDIFQTQQVSYQIVGGLAARIHGGTRAVADIDLYIPKLEIDKVLPLISQYISKPLQHYIEGAWDVEYCQLIYQGQKIEIGLSPGSKIRVLNSQQWVALETDFSKSVNGCYCGINLPTIPVADLLSYKQLLGREVDLIDIAELTASLK